MINDADNITRKEIEDRMEPYSGEHVADVSTDTLHGKVMCGYQGWFAAKGDESGQGWIHYGLNEEELRQEDITFDIWPDMSELTGDEKYPTDFKYSDGETACLFSSYNRKTVLRHFEWMKDYGIDGVFLQRFGVSLKTPLSFNHCNTVASHVREGANKHGRTWAMMYDLSGLEAGEIKSIIMEDWKLLVDKMKIREDKSYLHHNGKPVISVWGIGFYGQNRNCPRGYSLEECDELVDFLKNDPVYGGNTIKLGVPTYWRTVGRDCLNDPKLLDIINKADIVSPWVVGRYGSDESAKHYANDTAKDDIEWCGDNDKDFIPVVFPGFSWHNLQKTRGWDAPMAQIPRLDGQFLWTQAASHISNGAKMIYIAMFDEVDEGTAIFKCSNNPPEGTFLTYEDMPSDHYLWLAGKISEAVQNKEASLDMPGREADSRQSI